MTQQRTEIQQGILNRGNGKLCAGTRVEILRDDNKPWEKKGDTISHGYITVRLRSKPSHKLREQGFYTDGVFDIEKDAVTILRPRSDLVPSISRTERRERKRKNESTKPMDR